MDINYKQMADRVVAHAKAKNDVDLDFSRESLKKVDDILGYYNEHIEDYSGEEGEEILWNLAVYFGVYIGETLLRLQLKDNGYDWLVVDSLPVLQKDEKNSMSPIAKAHKRILYGAQDSVKSFCDIAFLIGKGELI